MLKADLARANQDAWHEQTCCLELSQSIGRGQRGPMGEGMFLFIEQNTTQAQSHNRLKAENE